MLHNCPGLSKQHGYNRSVPLTMRTLPYRIKWEPHLHHNPTCPLHVRCGGLGLRPAGGYPCTMTVVHGMNCEQHDQARQQLPLVVLYHALCQPCLFVLET